MKHQSELIINHSSIYNYKDVSPETLKEIEDKAIEIKQKEKKKHRKRVRESINQEFINMVGIVNRGNGL